MGKQDKLAYGIHPVRELLAAGVQVRQVWLEQGKAGQSDTLRELRDLCAELRVPCGEKSGRFLTKLAGTDSHQGAVAVYVPRDLEIAFTRPGATPRFRHFLCLYLDGIQDPQNFGAIVRSAEFFAVDQVFYPERHAAPFTPAAVKASAGAGLHHPPYKVSSPAGLLELSREKGFAVIGTVPEQGQRPDQLDWQRPCLVVTGGEHAGVGSPVRRFCTDFVTVPAKGAMASLNASVATGIFLYHIRAAQGWLEPPDG